MKIRTVFGSAFRRYGKVLTGYDVKELLLKLDSTSDKPLDKTIYVPGDAGLESLPVAKQFCSNAYGGMPIQIGYCNGYNTKLNCLEWHRGSEINIPSSDIVLLLAPLQSVKNGKLNTNCVEAFYVPAGTVVQIYETTLHYAPCNGVKNGEVNPDGFRVVVILPKGTNLDKPQISQIDKEDKLLWAANKWLIAHPESAEAKQGAFALLQGANINLASL